MPQRSKKKKLKNLETALKQCHITVPPKPKQDYPSEVNLYEKIEPTLLSMWPKLKMKVPAIFLHQSNENDLLTAKKISALDIKFLCCRKSNGVMFMPQGFNDHKNLVQYFEKNQFPYHTFGHPSKRKMRIVIKGLPKDVDLNKLKQSLKSVEIPVIRVHKMCMKDIPKERDNPVLAVVPYDASGKKLLRVRKVLGYDVMMEPPHVKAKQCYRCQKWGHSQRYCHGQVKCVKCAGEHLSKKCTRVIGDGPPKCANCEGDHTASYRQCPNCPESAVYKSNKAVKGAFRVTIPDLSDGEEFQLI